MMLIYQVSALASGGDVTEGTNAVFNITATHVGSAPSILVRVQVSEVGNFLSNSVGIESVMVSVGTTTPYRVSTEDDAYDEENGSVTATILKDTDGSVDYGIGANTSTTVQVSDNDDPPTISISVAPVTEGNDPTSNAEMEFTVEIDEQSHHEISVNYATTTTGTATSDTDFSTNPGDFLAQSGTLTFNKRSISESGVITAGITSQTFSVPIYGDALDEDDETVIVSLSSARNATIASGEDFETGTISDDDDPQLSVLLTRRV